MTGRNLRIRHDQAFFNSLHQNFNLLLSFSLTLTIHLTEKCVFKKTNKHAKKGIKISFAKSAQIPAV